MKIFRIFSLVFASVALSIYPVMISTGCSGWEPSMEDYKNLFDPDILPQKFLSPWFLDENPFAAYDDQSELNPEVANIMDWKKYFGQKNREQDIRELIYQSSLQDLDSLMGIDGESVIPQRFQKNELFRKLSKKKDTDFLNYLRFAKHCEPHVTTYWNEWSSDEMDIDAMEKLIDEGIHQLHSCKSKFLQLRYAYQLVRLAHYSGELEKAVSLFNDFVPNKTGERMYWWALEQKAGALYSLGKNSEASLLFAKVFAHSPERRLTASKSYEFSSNYEQLDENLQACEGQLEKTTLLFLHSFTYNYDDFVPDLERIYNIDANSEYLMVILERLIRNIEIRMFDPDNYYYDGGFDETRQNEVFTLFDKIIADKKSEVLYIWHFFKAYLLTITKQPESASKELKIADELWPQNQKKPDKLFDLYAFINFLNTPFEFNKISETKILTFLKKLDAEQNLNHTADAKQFIIENLSLLYRNAGNDMMADLLINRLTVQNQSGVEKIKRIDLFINLFTSDDNTDLQKYFIDQFRYKLNDLYYYKGTLLFAEDQLNEALNYYNKVNDSRFTTLSADPFSYRIRDCHDCDYEVPQRFYYTQKTLLQRILELKALCRSDPDHADQYYFLLGNVYYNMTYWGNAWQVLSEYRCNSCFEWGMEYFNDYLEYNAEYYFLTENYFNSGRSAMYYEKVMEISKDQELKAKACYLASKCELTLDYVDQRWEFDDPGAEIVYSFTGPENEYGSYYFSKLEKEYSNTQYYLQVLQECSYFRSYLNNN